MRLLIVALAALPIGAATAEPPAPLPSPERPVTNFTQIATEAGCPKPLAFWGSGPGRAEMKTLNELPPADAFHAAYRTDKDGCLDPVMVGYQYGRRR
jgi:hypothetical protein